MEILRSLDYNSTYIYIPVQQQYLFEIICGLKIIKSHAYFTFIKLVDQWVRAHFSSQIF